MFLHIVIYSALYGGLWLHTVMPRLLAPPHHITIPALYRRMAIQRFDSTQAVYPLNDASAAAADTG